MSPRPNTFSLARPHDQQYVEHAWAQLLSMPLVAPPPIMVLGLLWLLCLSWEKVQDLVPLISLMFASSLDQRGLQC